MIGPTDVRKYVPRANEAAIDGIVKHLGGALRRRDGSFVAGWDKSERDRVCDSFLKKKLGLSLSDINLDRAIADIWYKMRDDRDKPRVTFYYLLAEKYDKLSPTATLKIGGATTEVQASHPGDRRFMTALQSGKVESDTFKAAHL